MKHAACAILFLLLPATLLAWHTNTHLQMTRDAISLMPADFKKIFQDHQTYTEAGITDPDMIVKDWQNHYYIPTNPPEGGALERIDKIINIIRIKFKGTKDSDASKQLCYLAHYIGDLWSPESIVNRDASSDLDFFQNHDIVVLYEGYEAPIQSIHNYLQQRSEWRWRLENSKEISTLLYSEAVNDIARVWLTLWQESGRETGKQQARMLEHEPGILEDNLMRYLSVEERNELHGGWYERDWRDDEDYSYSQNERTEYKYDPTDSQLYGRVLQRNDQQMLSRIRPEAPFQFREVSLRTIGDKSYLVMRIRNKSNAEIPSIAFLVPGVRGAVALIKAIKPGQVRKVDIVIPAAVTKDQIQVIFSALE